MLVHRWVTAWEHRVPLALLQFQLMVKFFNFLEIRPCVEYLTYLFFVIKFVDELRYVPMMLSSYG